MNDVSMMLRALRQDESPRSGWVVNRPEGSIAQPPSVFIVGAGWAEANGSRISGWDASRYFSHRPNIIDRWRLRRAVRAWERRRLARERREWS